MIKFENTQVVGFEPAIRGMRNPMNSWDKMDSYPAVDCKRCGRIEREGNCKKEDRDCTGFECYFLAQNDLDLMKRLRKAGTDHRKYLRMINVYVDITAPLYWWKEFDTYKVGTVANSCSTMHKIHSKEFTLDDFSIEHLYADPFDGMSPASIFSDLIEVLNENREKFLETKNKVYWWQIIQLLPSSYNQKRTVMLNYEVLNNMYEARKSHKLDEWRVGFIDWINTLPYTKELITGEEQREVERCRF